MDDESKPLTTSITEFGRYRYRCAPMGLTSSGDEFCARRDKALAGVLGVHKLVDDILIYGKDADKLMDRIEQVFTRCQDWGIILSKDKYQFGKEVKFAGYIINRPTESTLPDSRGISSLQIRCILTRVAISPHGNYYVYVYIRNYLAFFC